MKLRELPPADEDAGAQGVVAVFDLADYSPATRLAEPLSLAERVMLACREWLLKTLADDDDLVVTWGVPRMTVRSASRSVRSSYRLVRACSSRPCRATPTPAASR